MDKNVMRVLGIVALVVCAVCVFVAIERYQTNAKNVRAMNQGPIRLPGFGGTLETNFEVFKPATPAATKYAIFFALISGAGGVVLLVMSAQTKQTVDMPGDPTG
ncbi:MAG: hypothetical protein J7M40_07780 [Planctomycetes bacterium]|nr:hypothetical protein [Planctomycetota bacterium]